MPYVTAAVLAGTAIYGAIESSDRKKKAKRAIEQLKKQQPKYKTAKELQTEAEATIQEGYSPEEVARFNQSLARGGRAAYQLGVTRNPNLTSAVQSGINYANVGARTQFAAQDAALRRQKIQQYASMLTGQSNAQTSADIMSKREQEIAYGNAKAQANADIYNSLMQLGYAGASAAQAGAFRGRGAQPATEGGVGNAFNGDAPLMGYQNAPVDTNANNFARNLYGNPTGNTFTGEPTMMRYNTLAPVRRTAMVAAQPSPYQPFNPYANEQYASDINVPDQDAWIRNPNSYNYYTRRR